MSDTSTFSYEKLPGLDRERLLPPIEEVLQAHGVRGVELIWQTDNQGWVLKVTLEHRDATEPGAGVTLDLCAAISRDLSARLDDADLIGRRYRLEVGSPGLERTLYSENDFKRFAGRLARLKLSDPLEGQVTLRGRLLGIDERGCIGVQSDFGEHYLEPAQIAAAQLVVDMAELGKGSPGAGTTKRKRERASEQNG